MGCFMYRPWTWLVLGVLLGSFGFTGFDDAQSALAAPETPARSAAGQAQSSPARDEARAILWNGLELLLKGGDRQRVRALLEQAAQRDPTFAAPHYNLASLDETEENWDAATARLQKVMDLAPNSRLSERARTELARLSTIRQLWATPEGQKKVRYDQAVDQARLLLQVNRPDDAMAEAESALRIDDSRHEARLVLADALTRIGRYDVAIVHLKLAAAAAPAIATKIKQAIAEVENLKKYDVLVTQADAALGDANYHRATDLYRSAWRLRPDREACGLRMAMALGFAGDFGQAQSTLEKLVASKSPQVSREAANQLATLRTLREQNEIITKSRKDAAEMRQKTAELAKQMGIDFGSEPSNQPPATVFTPKPTTPVSPTKPAVKDPVLDALENLK